jgi:hypothetical protein
VEARAAPPPRAAAAGLGDGRRQSRPRPRSPESSAVLGVLNLEGIFTRYENADRELDKISKLTKERATAGMQKIYASRST